MPSIIESCFDIRNPHHLRSPGQSAVRPHSPRTVSHDLTSGHLTLFLTVCGRSMSILFHDGVDNRFLSQPIRRLFARMRVFVYKEERLNRAPDILNSYTKEKRHDK